MEPQSWHKIVTYRSGSSPGTAALADVVGDRSGVIHLAVRSFVDVVVGIQRNRAGLIRAAGMKRDRERHRDRLLRFDRRYVLLTAFVTGLEQAVEERGARIDVPPV